MCLRLTKWSKSCASLKSRNSFAKIACSLNSSRLQVPSEISKTLKYRSYFKLYTRLNCPWIRQIKSFDIFRNSHSLVHPKTFKSINTLLSSSEEKWKDINSNIQTEFHQVSIIMKPSLISLFYPLDIFFPIYLLWINFVINTKTNKLFDMFQIVNWI